MTIPNLPISQLHSAFERETGHKLQLNGHGDGGRKNRARLYRIWAAIKTRCYNPRQPSFKNYGARGVSVCEPWRTSYVIFRAWALANGYTDSLEIDRIDNNGNYEPGNCRWVERVQNCQNKRVSHRLPNGETVKSAATRLGMHPQSLRYRMRVSGLSPEEAVRLPKRIGGKGWRKLLHKEGN